MDTLSAIAGALKLAVTKAVDFAAQRHSGNKQLQHEIDRIKFQVKTNRSVNTFFPLLRELRRIFMEHRELMQDGDNCAFFVNWLRHPIVELGGNAGSEFWTMPKIQELRKDIEAVKA